jgi:hypothetical protein
MHPKVHSPPLLFFSSPYLPPQILPDEKYRALQGQSRSTSEIHNIHIHNTYHSTNTPTIPPILLPTKLIEWKYS